MVYNSQIFDNEFSLAKYSAYIILVSRCRKSCDIRGSWDFR